MRRFVGYASGMTEWLAGVYRMLSAIACFVGALTTFYALLFADIPVGRNGKPKPPLRVQLFQTGAIFAAGVPGVAWTLTRAARGKHDPPWN